MPLNRPFTFILCLIALGFSVVNPPPAAAQSEWEMTPESEKALERGLEWLAKNQGEKGNWDSNDLGLVSMGAAAFLAAGHSPGRGKYGKTVEKALNFVVDSAKPSGLLNISNSQRDMYNHGLATFVLGQAHGMTTSQDRRLNGALDRALQLIANTQCEDGGWDYKANRQANGHDLSLAVMQAKALRSAVDSGLSVPEEVIDAAIASVREHYSPNGVRHDAPESELRRAPGQFTYGRGGSGASLAMAAAGVVCLQEFGQDDDWRIPKNIAILSAAVKQTPKHNRRDGQLPFDAYTLYYISQALYQTGGNDWDECYPILRDRIVKTQKIDGSKADQHGAWEDRGFRGQSRVGGKPGRLYGTATACFVLAIPNRYLPILQEGEIEGLQKKLGN